MHMQNNRIFLSICIAVCKSYGFVNCTHLKNTSAFIQRFSCAVWSWCDVKGTETQNKRQGQKNVKLVDCLKQNGEQIGTNKKCMYTQGHFEKNCRVNQ